MALTACNTRDLLVCSSAIIHVTGLYKKSSFHQNPTSSGLKILLSLFKDSKWKQRLRTPSKQAMAQSSSSSPAPAPKCPPLGKIQITVKKGRSLLASDDDGLSDPYVIVKLGTQVLF